jgi:hypothetical protein
MARVTRIEIGPPQGHSHPTEVHARVKTFGEGARGPIVQIDTFGSLDRDVPGKLSQTLQFDRESGIKMLAILKSAFDP